LSQPFNSFQAIAPLTAHKKGVNFFGGILPSKMGHFAPFSAMIQALSKTRVFLLSENDQRLLCMGRTFTANKPLPLNNCPKQFEYSRLLRRSGAKF
jgi:hypothetical protein